MGTTGMRTTRWLVCAGPGQYLDIAGRLVASGCAASIEWDTVPARALTRLSQLPAGSVGVIVGEGCYGQSALDAASAAANARGTALTVLCARRASALEARARDRGVDACVAPDGLLGLLSGLCADWLESDLSAGAVAPDFPSVDEHPVPSLRPSGHPGRTGEEVMRIPFDYGASGGRRADDEIPRGRFSNARDAEAVGSGASGSSVPAKPGAHVSGLSDGGFSGLDAPVDAGACDFDLDEPGGFGAGAPAPISGAPSSPSETDLMTPIGFQSFTGGTAFGTLSATLPQGASDAVAPPSTPAPGSAGFPPPPTFGRAGASPIPSAIGSAGPSAQGAASRISLPAPPLAPASRPPIPRRASLSGFERVPDPASPACPTPPSLAPAHGGLGDAAAHANAAVALRAEPLDSAALPQVEAPNNDVPTICLASARGGVGKSTIAVLMALAMAREGLSVALVDLAYQFGTCLGFLGLGETDGLPELRAGQPLALDARLLDRCRVQGAQGLVAYEFCRLPERAELFVPLSGQLVRAARDGCDVAVVDLPAGLNEGVAQVLELSDRCLVVGDQQALSLESMAAAVALCTRLGVPRTKLVAVINRCDARHRDEGFLTRARFELQSSQIMRVVDGGAEVTRMLEIGCAGELVAMRNRCALSSADLASTLCSDLGCSPGGGGTAAAIPPRQVARLPVPAVPSARRHVRRPDVREGVASCR